MNEIETNVVESQTAEFVAAAHNEPEAISELNASQLMLVGGGSITVVFT